MRIPIPLNITKYARQNNTADKHVDHRNDFTVISSIHYYFDHNRVRIAFFLA